MFGLGRVLGSNVDPLNPVLRRHVEGGAARSRRRLSSCSPRRDIRTASRPSLKVTPQYPYTVRTGEVLAEQLAKVGIRVKLEQIEWGQWLERVVQERRLRHDDHRPRRGVGRRELREPEVLLPVR